jgi:FAD/FMN-containing dehydrogenase
MEVAASVAMTSGAWEAGIAPRYAASTPCVGSSWDFLVRSKQRFDPDHILTPGQGMFPG